jgi:hypothetical protein
MSKYLVYLITNKINNKKYVGQTNAKLQRRWNQHVNAANTPKCSSYGSYFSNALRKYGRENWDLEILVDNLQSREEAYKYEIEFIAKYQSNNSAFGYNSTEGGEGAEYWKKRLTETWQNEEHIKKVKKCIRKKRKCGTNKYLGVLFVKQRQLYRGEVGLNNKKYYAEPSDDLVLAAKRRDVLALRLLGSDAILNFKIEENELLNEIDLTDLNAIKISVEEYVLERKSAKIKRNRKKLSNYKNKYIGVIFNKKTNRFVADICVNGKSIYIGTFINEEDAAIARDQKAFEFLKETAQLNFPDKINEIVNFDVKKHIKQKREKLKETTKYVGVSFDKKHNLYKAYIYIDGKNTYIGSFKSEIEAAIMRDKKAIEFLKNEAIINIPTEQHDSILESIRIEKENLLKSKIKIKIPRNLHKRSKFTGTNKYIGVYKHDNKFLAKFNYNKKSIYLGLFDSEEEAAKARDLKAIQILGEGNVTLNFPPA